MRAAVGPDDAVLDRVVFPGLYRSLDRILRPRRSSGWTLASSPEREAPRTLGRTAPCRSRPPSMSRLPGPVPTIRDGQPAAPSQPRSLSSSSSIRARASYCRNRPFIALRAMLMKVVGWNGRSRKVTLPSKAKVRRTRTRIGSIRTAGQKDKGQVRPCGCSRRGCERLHLARKHRLIGRDDEESLVVNDGLERLEVRANSAPMPACPEAPSNRRVTPVRSQNQALRSRSN